MLARQIMNSPVVTVHTTTKLVEVARTMIEGKLGCVPVVDDQGCFRGLITQSDFAAKEHGIPFSTLQLPQVFHQWIPPSGIETLYQKARDLTAADIMSTEPAVATEDTSIDEVVRIMLDRNINHVPILRGCVPVGIVSRHDLLRLMVGSQGDSEPTRSSSP
jgi:CBS domain-containing protein